MSKRAICSVVLSLVLMMLIPAAAYATDIRASERFATYNAKLYVESNGDLDIYFSVAANETMDILGASRIAVQRHDGSRWVTECTLTVQDTPAIQTSNAARYSASIPYEPDYSNADYRAVVTFYAKDSAGSSTAQATTG